MRKSNFKAEVNLIFSKHSIEGGQAKTGRKGRKREESGVFAVGPSQLSPLCTSFITIDFCPGMVLTKNILIGMIPLGIPCKDE